ncbi:MAG: flavodoxin-dependent (E)-4-hydroxy-3-methylbut-2-enyl-diphosphate synthase [Eubacteriales bacterium]|nr:flavodoxin-dependent (E)-4-hydroxy-3-methylbut-2-enyl-diphosphate synthase [Eubacteriales bacterium]
MAQMYSFNRRNSQAVKVAGLQIGGGAPIVVQSMNNRPALDVAGNIEQIQRLAEAGCQMTRLAVPNAKAAGAFKEIKAKSVLPLVADIHFQASLAILALQAGCDKLRLNPGNIRDKEELKRAVILAEKLKVPIRVGVNSGSLSPQILQRFGAPNAEALVAQALEAVREVEEAGHSQIVISIKSSDPRILIEANRELSRRTFWPLHLGLTEAGTERGGLLRSAAGIGTLLAEGIGDTIRISLQAEPEREIKACYELLRALGLSNRGAELIVCPGCGRTEVDLRKLALRLEDYLATVKEPLTVALMGCVVNGPGEAREADVGLAGGKGNFALFRAGKIIAKLNETEAYARLIQEIENLREDFSELK